MTHPRLDLAIKKLLLGSLAVTAAVLTACQDTPSPVAPGAGVRTAKSGTSGKPGSVETVLFSGTKNGNHDIYAMNPDGSNVRQLTADTAWDAFPDFAPGNRKFVWVRGSNSEHAQLLTANFDGSKPTPLTTGRYISDPRYSPDGTKIAFVARVDEPVAGTSGFINNADIYVINTDGTGLKRLTSEQSEELSPTWSPNGQMIAFQSNRADYPSLYTMTAGGLDVRLLIGCGSLRCVDPAYSPDGSKIAFGIQQEGKIAVLDVGSHFITSVGPSTDRTSRHPTWTKDGTQVLFGSNRGIEGTLELYAGTPGLTQDYTVRRLTVFSPGAAELPSYSH
jgi:Tol biopolymer transport system component